MAKGEIKRVKSSFTFEDKMDNARASGGDLELAYSSGMRGRMKETKSAVQSTTIGGGILAIAGAVGSYLELAGKLPIGGAAPLVAALGGLLSILGRLKGEIKVIDRLF